MAERAIVHIGHAKTGTSSLQATCKRSFNLLSKEGIYYPLLSGRAHRFLEHHFTGTEDHSEKLADIVDFCQREGPTTVLLSSEFLNKMAEDGVVGLSSYMRSIASECAVVLYVRHPISFVASSIQQNVRMLKKPLSTALFDFKLFPAEKRIERWCGIFGRENVIVKEFSRTKLVNGDIIDDFFHTIDRPDVASKLDRVHRNESISYLAAIIGENIASHTHNPVVYRNIIARIPGDKLQLPQDLMEQIVINANRDMVYLRDSWNIDFFSSPLPTVTQVPPPITPDAADAIAQLIVALVEDRNSLVRKAVD